MTRDEWVTQFADDLRKLRPHLSDKIVYTIALSKHDAKEHPRDIARQYHKQQPPPSSAKQQKR